MEDLGNAGKNFFKSIGESWGFIKTQNGTVMAPADNESIDEMKDNSIISAETAEILKNQTIPTITSEPAETERPGLRETISSMLGKNPTKGVDFDTQRYAQWIADKTGAAVGLASDSYAFVTEILIPLPLEFMHAMQEQGYIKGFFDAVENIFSQSLRLLITSVNFIVQIAVEAFNTLVVLVNDLGAAIPQLQTSAATLSSIDTSKLQIPESVRLEAKDLSTRITSSTKNILSGTTSRINQILGGGV
jgi:hypothetical protein